MINSKYCKKVDNAIHVDGLGEFAPCCNFKSRHVFGFSKYSTIEEYKNSQELKDLKDRLLNGEEVPNCSICWQNENNGLTSMRTFTNENDEVGHLYFNFGNACNAACRICSPWRSSYLANYLEKITDLDTSLIDRSTKPQIWYKKVISDFVHYIEQFDLLEMSGGEVFINKYYDEMIKHLHSSGKKLPRVRIITNGSFKKHQLEKLSTFGRVELNISIDGCDDTYDLLRWPLKFEEIEANILEAADYPEYQLNLDLVVHNLNLHNIIDTLLWWYALDVPNFKRWNFIWLNTPEHYDPLLSPKFVRDKVKKEVDDYLEIAIDTLDDYRISILKELQELMAQDTNTSHANAFHEWTLKHDKSRGCNTYDTIGWTIEDVYSR